MKILNVIDILLYRTFLSKFYLPRGLDYQFVEPDRGHIVEAMTSFEPDVVLLQDDYHQHSQAEVAAYVRAQAARQGLSPAVLVLRTSPQEPTERSSSGDSVFVRRENLGDVIESLAESVRTRPAADDVTKHRRGQILFVDPGKTLFHVVRAALAPGGYELRHALDAAEALSLCAEAAFELVLTSVQLPGMDGLELCRRLKESSAGGYRPVIVLSSSDDPLDVDTAFNSGADDYLLKSFTPRMLADKISDHLDAVHRKRQNKILVVDDSKLIRELLRHSFIKSGLNVLVAENGRQALEIALAEKPDVVVTDVDMPELNGYGLCESMRQTPELQNVFVVMMSARDRTCDIKRGERLGVSRYFVKPFDVEKMLLVVEQLLAESYRHYKHEYEHVLWSMKSLVTALEARDEYTKGHTARVSAMSLRLARHMGLSDDSLRDLEIAANLHDIGKIGVRDAVLLKPGVLTDEEYAKIQEHAVIGAEILRPIASLAAVVPLIMYHHERWDGDGYPTCLRGEDIPLGARIIAVADAFDAMTSDRPYRKGMASQKALDIIAREMGKQFCPTCARAFLEMKRSDVRAGIGRRMAAKAG
ncbi:response regulator [Desulfolutivibrio sp.]|uniref:response regulator n=1 Tax=Desulfolutivibrio sp. TaxID=2773296 RepID=UPI002F9617FD